MPRDTQPLDAKLDRFDEHSTEAVAWIVEWLTAQSEDFVACAILEELADAIVYMTRLLNLLGEKNAHPSATTASH